MKARPAPDPVGSSAQSASALTLCCVSSLPGGRYCRVRCPARHRGEHSFSQMSSLRVRDAARFAARAVANHFPHALPTSIMFPFAWTHRCCEWTCVLSADSRPRTAPPSSTSPAGASFAINLPAAVCLRCHPLPAAKRLQSARCPAMPVCDSACPCAAPTFQHVLTSACFLQPQVP